MLPKMWLLLVVLVPVQLVLAQERILPTERPIDVAQVELETVLVEAKGIPDKLALINVRTRAAALISFSDPRRSEIMFGEIWTYLKEVPEANSDRRRAQAFVLRHLFHQNPQLAKQLLRDQLQVRESALAERAIGRDTHLLDAGKLALELIETNPRAASEILELTVPSGMTVPSFNALIRLREVNPLLSDAVAAKAINGIKTQPDIVSLSGLQLISAYVFPEDQPVEITPSLSALRIEFFTTTYEVLRASLAQSEAVLRRDWHYTQADMRFRAMYQARVAITLAALAPRLRPHLSAELDTLANKLGGALPPNVAEFAKRSTPLLNGEQVDSARPELGILAAMSKGDFATATNLINALKDEDEKKSYLQSVAKLEAKALLARGDTMGAMTCIRKVEDGNARLILYLEAVKVAAKDRNLELSSLIVNEARTSIPQVNRNGLHARAYLVFATKLNAIGSRGAGLELLEEAIAIMNRLPNPEEESGAAAVSPTELAWRELNDPRSFLDTPELDRAFSTFGASDLNNTLIAARKIQPKTLQLVARLESLSNLIKSEHSEENGKTSKRRNRASSRMK